MLSKKIEGGVVHELPLDLKKNITSDKKVLDLWQDITPLARNEWICWVEDAKKPETRQRRIDLTNKKLLNGLRRPCCWQGCSHR